MAIRCNLLLLMAIAWLLVTLPVAAHPASATKMTIHQSAGTLKIELLLPLDQLQQANPIWPALTAQICATENFIATLTTTEQSAILYEWDNSNTERTIWSNLPTGNVQRNGMRIGELSDTAYDALITVAQTLLNDAGYEDFRGVSSH